MAHTNSQQISHSSPSDLVDNLRTVWKNVAKTCLLDATLVVRFGGMGRRAVDPLKLLAKSSLANSDWFL